LVLEPLTADEEARHARGIEKMRRKLFRIHQPADYFIVQGSERILSAPAELCWNAACGSYRTLRFGGISYDVDCGGSAGLHTFTVRHLDSAAFVFWLGAPQGHTVSCIRISFQDMDEVPYAYVHSCRRVTLAPTYVGMNIAPDEVRRLGLAVRRRPRRT
jgi:hypothetical protein